MYNIRDIYKEQWVNVLSSKNIWNQDWTWWAEVLLDELTLDLSDEEIIALTNTWKQEAWELNRTLIQLWERNYRYYIWNFSDYENEFLKSINNRIFINIETIIPIITSKPAQPVVYPWTWSDESKELAKMHQKVLLNLYKKLKIQKIAEQLVRHNQIYRLWVIKYWLVKWKVATKIVLPTRLWIDPKATCNDDAEYIWEANQFTARDLKTMYPKHEDAINELSWWKNLAKLNVMEWRTKDFLCVILEWKYVLNKIKNPHFSYIWEKKEVNEFGEYDQEDYRYNHFESPKVPYIFFQVFNSWLWITDDTTALEQSIPLQDAITKICLQIQDNIELVANPILRAQWFDKVQIDLINRRTVWDAVWIAQDQDLRYLNPWQVPSYVQIEVDRLQSSIDDVFGTHATTRWDREWQETLWWRELLRQWDEDRQSPYWRAMERMLWDLYNAWTHLIKVYYDEERLMPDLTSKWAWEYIKVTRNNIWDWLEISVVPWSTLPDDKVSKKQEAKELWNSQAITIEKLYENLWWDNYEEEATRFMLSQAENKLVNAQADQIIWAYIENWEMLSPKELAKLVIEQQNDWIEEDTTTSEEPKETIETDKEENKESEPKTSWTWLWTATTAEATWLDAVP